MYVCECNSIYSIVYEFVERMCGKQDICIYITGGKKKDRGQM